MKKINSATQTSAMYIDTLAKQSTEKVYNLAAGDPNLPLQEAIINSYKNINLEDTHNYCGSQGLLTLREKINPDNPNKVIISNGAKQLIYLALMSVANIGDEIVIIGPCWSSYMEICKMLNLHYKLITGTEENHYIPEINVIKNIVGEHTAAVLFNNPNNPTGVVYDEDYVEGLYNICKENNCWLISDEIYSDLIYVNKPFNSLKNRENVIYINGFSKSYSLTGWRLGYCIAEEDIIKAMVNNQSQMSGPPSTLIQTIISDCYDKLIKPDIALYKERVDLIANQSKKLQLFKPDGGFYFYLPIDTLCKSSTKLCKEFLDKYNIALTPGDDYGIINTIRLSIANINLEDLKLIVKKLGKI